MVAYEHMIVSAVRYALGRLTYIVGLTVDYVLKDIEQKKLSQKCLYIMKQDITEEMSPDKLSVDPIFTADCIKEWQRLLDRIEKELR